MATKTEFRLFVLPEYEEEQKYLQDMHRKGWRLVRAWPYLYRFESCQPEEFAYEMDFRSLSKAEKAAYIGMTEDYGWEHVMDYERFSYFRKKISAEMQDEERELFSDDRSRMELALRLFRQQMIPVSIMFFLCLALMVVRVFFGDPISGADYHIVLIIFALLLIFVLYLFIRCARGFMRLKRKYGGDSEEA